MPQRFSHKTEEWEIEAGGEREGGHLPVPPSSSLVKRLAAFLSGYLSLEACLAFCCCYCCMPLCFSSLFLLPPSMLGVREKRASLQHFVASLRSARGLGAARWGGRQQSLGGPRTYVRTSEEEVAPSPSPDERRRPEEGRGERHHCQSPYRAVLPPPPVCTYATEHCVLTYTVVV